MTEEERRELVIRRDNYYGQIRAFRDRWFVSERTRCASRQRGHRWKSRYPSRATLDCILWINPRADPPEGPGSACSTRGGPGQEHQTELANLNLVAVGEHRGVDRFMIDVSVVEAIEVDEQELFVLQPKLDVAAADCDVVEDDVVVWMPARRCDGLIEQELGTGVGAAYHA